MLGFNLTSFTDPVLSYDKARISKKGAQGDKLERVMGG